MRSKIDHFDVLVSRLLTHSKSSASSLKTRLKVSNLIYEFEDRASGKLKEFINESTSRYKGMKSGNLIGAVISKSKGKYSSLSNNILNDNLYTKLNIDKEKEFLAFKPDLDTSNKDLNQIYKEIKQHTESLPSTTNRETLKTIQSTPKNKLTLSSANRKELVFMTSLNTDKSLPKSMSQPSICVPLTRKALFKNQNLFKGILTQDTKTINNDIDHYKKVLSDFKKRIIEKQDNKSRNLLIVFPEEHKNDTLFSASSLRFLTYEKPVKEKVAKYIPPIPQNSSVNGMMKCSRRYHKPYSPKVIKTTQTNELDHLPETIVSNTNYDNTITLVKNEASNSLLIDKVFKKKRDVLTNSLKSHELYLVTQYDKVIEERMNEFTQKLLQLRERKASQDDKRKMHYLLSPINK